MVNGCLSYVLFAAPVGLQMSEFEPSLPSFCVFFPLCFPFWGGVDEGGQLLLVVLILLFFIPYPKITCFLAFQVTKRVAHLVLAASLSPKIPRKIQVTSVQP